MKFSARQIASFLKGEIVGDANKMVSGISKIEEGKEGTLSFLSNPKYEKYIYTTNASIVLVNNEFRPAKTYTATLIKVPDAYEAFASLLDLYQQSKEKRSGIHKKSVIEKSAKIGKNSYIGAFVYVGENVSIGENVSLYPHVYIGDNVVIGNNVTLYSGVKVYEDCVLGNEVTIHSSAIIGSDGFGFAPQSDGTYKKIPQLGNVIVEDFVEIGANTTIDRATMGSTIICKGVKLDNLIHLAHNVVVGENTVMAAQTGVAGSTKIGKNCMFGGQVGLSPHINIADGVKLAAQSGVGQNIENVNETQMGSPSFNAMDYKKSYYVYTKLPELYRTIARLEKEIHELKSIKDPL